LLIEIINFGKNGVKKIARAVEYEPEAALAKGELDIARRPTKIKLRGKSENVS